MYKLTILGNGVKRSKGLRYIQRECIRSIGINKLADGGSGISRAFEPDQVEAAVAERWKRNNFGGNSRINGKHFSEDGVFRMILPPPNVTGKLHLGHALTVAIQDSIIRWKVMTGSHVKWIPGFDHAGIATHSVVSKKLQKTATNTKSDSRSGYTVDEQLLRNSLVEFSKTSRSTIRHQLEKMGVLLDWDSEYYTMDESHGNVVEEAFVTLFEAGLIRRQNGLVNWCCALQSSVADVECVAAEFDGKTTFRIPGYDQAVEFGRLYFIKYKQENSDGNLIVATSRPETIFGDVAVAVNPNDSRYSSIIGSRVLNPLTNELLPVIADERVKIDFGSGVLKLTPAHDKVDFRIGSDHSLPFVNILENDGRMNEKCGTYKGLGRFHARKAVVKLLVEKELLSEVQDYKGALDLCSRTGDIIEPKALPHWFMQTKGVTGRIVSAIHNGEIVIEPEFARNVLLHQLSNPQDWCLSRQIRWGHSIPAYFHIQHPDKWVAALSKESAVTKLGKILSMEIEEKDVQQDNDVLDTWFSSALIPLAVAGWPEIGEKQFQQLSLMETGHDILLFWVWRMAMVNLALVDKLPFRNVVLHGLVTDLYNRKMSKSRGNVVDPMDIIEGKTLHEMFRDAEESLKNGELDKNEYKLRVTGLKKDYPKGFIKCGADALRFTLLSQEILKHDLRLDVAYLENCRHFMNKMWQALRFYFAHVDKGINHPSEITKPNLSLTTTLPDLWILSCLHRLTTILEHNIPACKFYVCIDAIREFFHYQFCDFYIELIKKDLKEGENAETRILVMRYIFGTGLKLMHPFLPFISEDMWKYLTYDNRGLLINADYPRSDETAEFRDDDLMKRMSKAMKICSEIRSLRKKTGAENWSTVLTYAEITPKDSDILEIVPYLENLTSTKIVLESPSRTNRSNLLSQTLEYENGKSCRLSMARITGEGAEMLTLEKLQRLQVKLEKIKETLSNPSFLQSADDASKQSLLKKMQKLQSQIQTLHPGSSSSKKN